MCFLFFISLMGGLLRGQVLFRSFMKLAAPSGATQAPSRSASARGVALCAGRWALGAFAFPDGLASSP